VLYYSHACVRLKNGIAYLWLWATMYLLTGKCHYSVGALLSYIFLSFVTVPGSSRENYLP
jgi:hypothetical protein